MRKTAAQQLGDYIKKARLAKGFGLRTLAARSELTLGAIQQLEAGLIQEPRAKNLARIAAALEIPAGNLYAIIGYSVTEELPELQPYLRSKYKLTEAEVKQINAVFEKLAAKRSGKRSRP